MSIQQHYHRLLGTLERSLARRQGKGWGGGSIVGEITALTTLLNAETPIKLAVDVGGNIGDYTAVLRDHFPTADVHTFEPAASNLTLLNDRFGDDDNVSIIPTALSNSDIEATLYADKPGSGLGSLTHRRLEHRGNSFSHSEPVQTMRFDSYWSDTLQSRTIDIMKLDIEGHELDALQGCGKAIEHTRIVQFEFGGCNIDTRTFFQDFWYFFSEYGFDLYRITPGGAVALDKYRERDEFFSTTNYLARARSERKN